MEAIRDFFEATRLAPYWGQMGWDQIVNRFRRTVIGPFWLSAGLITTAVGLSFVFSANAGDWRSSFDYVFTGLLAWSLIGPVISEGTGAFTAAAGMLQSQRMPLTFTIYLHMQRQVVNFAAQLITFFVVRIALGNVQIPHWSLLFGLPVVVAIGFFLSLTVAIPATRFRDVGLLVGSTVGTLFFLTPVFWRAGSAGSARALLAECNPLTHMIELIRAPLDGVAASEKDWFWALCTLAAVIVIGLSTLQLFRKRIVFWL